MKLSEVKYSKCNQCGRGYPLAHFIAENKHGSVYKAHKNMRCAPCIRKEIHTLGKVKYGERISRENLSRISKLNKLLGAK